MSVGEQVRKRVGALLFEKGLSGVSRLGRLHPRAQPAQHGVEVSRDVPYRPGGAPHHTLDIYIPRQLSAGLRPGHDPATYSAPHPVVLYIHGGAFRILSKDTHWVMALAFARRGFLVFNINYRLAPQHPFPAALEDAAAALQFVKREAPRYQGDLSRLVFAGESAGANLVSALSLLTVLQHDTDWAQRAYDAAMVPRVVVPMCGILQVSDTARFHRRRPLPLWLQDRLHETEGAYIGEARDHAQIDLADPLRVFEQMAEGSRPRPIDRPLPAYFASVGTRDVLLDDTRRLGAALARLGTPHAVRYYPGEIHAFQALVYRDAARQCWSETYDFLHRHL